MNLPIEAVVTYVLAFCTDVKSTIIVIMENFPVRPANYGPGPESFGFNR